MAVWGGRYRFDDTSVTRRDFNGAHQTTINVNQDFIPRCQSYRVPRQPLRPKDHFVSPQPLGLNGRSVMQCPLGCLCNQMPSLAPERLAKQRLQDYRWPTATQASPYSVQQVHHTLSSRAWPNPEPLQPKHCQQLGNHAPLRDFSNAHLSNYAPLRNYHASQASFRDYAVQHMDSPQNQGPRRDYSSAQSQRSNHRDHEHQYSQGRTLLIPPRDAIPVGWGCVPYTTAYQDHFSGAKTSHAPPPPPTNPTIHQTRAESPIRWETSYTALCKNFLHLARGY